MGLFNLRFRSQTYPNQVQDFLFVRYGFIMATHVTVLKGDLNAITSHRFDAAHRTL
jgi:hypothetical protein